MGQNQAHVLLLSSLDGQSYLNSFWLFLKALSLYSVLLVALWILYD